MRADVRPRFLFALAVTLGLATGRCVAAHADVDLYSSPRPREPELRTSYEAQLIAGAGGRSMMRETGCMAQPIADLLKSFGIEVVGRDDVYGWLTRQMDRIDTIEVGAETYVLRMSTGTERRPDRLNFIDLNEHITLYVDVNVPAAFATIGVLMRIPGLPACAEKWSGPVTIQRK